MTGARHGTFTQAADGNWVIALTLTLARPHYRLMEIQDGDRVAVRLSGRSDWQWGTLRLLGRGWEWWGDQGREIEVYSGLECLVPEQIVWDRVPGVREEAR